MKLDYETPLQVVANSLRHYYGIETRMEEVFGSDIFPSNVAGTTETGTAYYTLRYNPKVRTLLALYNMAMDKGCDTGEAIIHYVLFHAFLEADDYAAAGCHLNAFRREIIRLQPALRSGEEQEEAGAQVFMQIFFTLFHEAFHIILHHKPEDSALTFGTTRDLLRDIKTELEDGLSMISEEELLRHPKTRQHLSNLIPPSLPEPEREAMEAEMREQMSHNPFSPEYIESVIQGADEMLVEEISCDRQAWLNLMPILQSDGATDRDILQVHLWFFTVFNAMDFNKMLQSQYHPALHERYRYDGRRVVLRHKAFKTLVRQYSPEIYKTVKSEYLDLSVGLEAVFRSSVLGLHRYEADLQRLYILYGEGTPHPDFMQNDQLGKEMEKVSQMLV